MLHDTNLTVDRDTIYAVLKLLSLVLGFVTQYAFRERPPPFVIYLETLCLTSVIYICYIILDFIAEKTRQYVLVVSKIHRCI